MRFSMDADIRDRVEPVTGRRIDGTKIRDLQPVEQVFLYIPDTVFHPSFFVSLADIASGYIKSTVVGKIKVFGVKSWRLTHNASKYSGFKIIDHDSFGNPAEKIERILMAAQKMFHGLADGKLDIHHTAITEHHDKKS